MTYRDDENVLNHLETELSSVELASLEYYLNIPFDPRLEQLLENEPPVIETSFKGFTDQFINNPLHPPSGFYPIDVELSDDEIAEIMVGRYSYDLSGSASFDGRHISLDIKVADEGLDSVATYIKDIPENDNAFVAYRQDADAPMASEAFGIKGLIKHLCLLANIDAASVNSNLAQIERDLRREQKGKSKTKPDHTVYQEYFMKLWTKIGREDETSPVYRTRKIIHELPQVDPRYNEVLRLQQKEGEFETFSTIATTLEYAKIYPDLDIEDTHCLNLEFTNEPEGTLEQLAERIVSSDAQPMRLKKASASQVVDGRRQTLDITDPAIQQLFVDWFDELVSA